MYVENSAGGLFCETVKKLALRNFRRFNFHECRLTHVTPLVAAKNTTK